jgi:hypothetical protein
MSFCRQHQEKDCLKGYCNFYRGSILVSRTAGAKAMKMKLNTRTIKGSAKQIAEKKQEGIVCTL